MGKNTNKESSKLVSVGKKTDVRQITICALLCAMNVVLARLMPPINTQVARLSIEAVPVILAGYFFGATSGMIVGFVGDTVGCLFSPYGWDPILCLSPMLIGMFAGLLRPLIRNARKPKDVWKVALTILPGMVLGSVFWTSQCFVWLGYSKDALPVLMGARVIEAAIELVLDSVVITLLISTGLFARAKLIPYKKQPMDPVRAISMGLLGLQILLVIVCSLTTGLRFMDDTRSLLDRWESGLAFFIPTILGIQGYLLSFFKRKENEHEDQ